MGDTDKKMKKLFENWRGFINESPAEEYLKKDLEATAKTLQDAYKLNQELKAASEKAPEKADEREKMLFKKIVEPAMDLVDEMTDKALNAKTREELRVARKEWRESLKASMAALSNFYNTARKQGFIISKPYLDMILKKSEQDLQHAKKMLKITADMYKGKINETTT